MARLDIYVNYELQASMKLVEGETTIGRDHRCRVQIPGAKVSRMHAVIQAVGLGHEIEHLGTTVPNVSGTRIDHPR